MTATTYELDEEAQTEIVTLMMRDTDFNSKTAGLVKPEYFENEIERTYVHLAIDHYKNYMEAGSATVWTQIFKDAIRSKLFRDDQRIDAANKLKHIFSLDVRSRAWLMEKTAEFAKNQATVNALMQAAKLVGTSDLDRFDKIETIMRKAAEIKLNVGSDGYDYFAEIDARTDERVAIAAGLRPPTGITTGVPELDGILKHKGWGRKELSLLMGGAKSSKSFHLNFFGGMAVLAGFNVLHITLENSVAITSERYDAFFSEIGMSEHETKPHAVGTAITAVGAVSTRGKFFIHEFAGGQLKPSMVQTIIDNYKAKGITFDVVVIDYLDLMVPNHRSESSTENSKSVFTDVRAIAQIENLVMLSATQTNREGHKSAVAKAEHVAEDFNRIRIADIVISINRNEDERAEQKARLFLAACRNQADGVTLFVKQNLDMCRAISDVESVE